MINAGRIEMPIARLIALNKGTSNNSTVDHARLIAIASLMIKIVEATLMNNIELNLENNESPFGFS